jgi:hypothetical protein
MGGGTWDVSFETNEMFRVTAMKCFVCHEPWRYTSYFHDKFISL